MATKKKATATRRVVLRMPREVHRTIQISAVRDELSMGAYVARAVRFYESNKPAR